MKKLWVGIASLLLAISLYVGLSQGYISVAVSSLVIFWIPFLVAAFGVYRLATRTTAFAGNPQTTPVSRLAAFNLKNNPTYKATAVLLVSILLICGVVAVPFKEVPSFSVDLVQVGQNTCPVERGVVDISNISSFIDRFAKPNSSPCVTLSIYLWAVLVIVIGIVVAFAL